MGFCLFNNAALGAAHLRAHHGLKRILLADLDLHHGNGTQAIFQDSPEVLYLSVHEYPAFPGTGALSERGSGAGLGYTVNVPLTRGHGDRDYAWILDRILRPVAEDFAPEFLLVSLGFDLYVHDRLGGMRVTPAGYALMASLITDIAERYCGDRLAVIMEGGYSVKGIRECGRAFLETLCATSDERLKRAKRASRGGRGGSACARRAVAVHRLA